MRADTIILVAWNFPLTSMKLYDCCAAHYFTASKEAVQRKVFCTKMLASSLSLLCNSVKCQISSICVTSQKKPHNFCLISIKQKRKKKNPPTKTQQARTRFNQTCASHGAASHIKGKFSLPLDPPPSHLFEKFIRAPSMRKSHTRANMNGMNTPPRWRSSTLPWQAMTNAARLMNHLLAKVRRSLRKIVNPCHVFRVGWAIDGGEESKFRPSVTFDQNNTRFFI